MLVKLVVPFTDMDRVEKAGLLVLPQTVKENNTPLASTGVIVKLGELFRSMPGLYQMDEEDRIRLGMDPKEPPPVLQEGTMVMFSRFAGSDVRVDEEQFRILDESEIMCTLTDVNNVVTPIKE